MGEKRDAYIAKLKTKLDEWSAQIDRLEEKAGRLNADSKAQLEKQVESLRAKRTALDGRIDELKRASEAAWKDFSGGVEAARDALDEAVKSAVARFK